MKIRRLLMKQYINKSFTLIEGVENVAIVVSNCKIVLMSVKKCLAQLQLLLSEKLFDVYNMFLILRIYC